MSLTVVLHIPLSDLNVTIIEVLQLNGQKPSNRFTH